MSSNKRLQNINDIPAEYYDSYEDYYESTAKQTPESKAVRAQHFKRILATCSKIVAGNLALSMLFAAMCFPFMLMNGLVVDNRLSESLILSGIVGAVCVAFANTLAYTTLYSERKNPKYALLLGAEIYNRCFNKGLPATLRACKKRLQTMMRNRNNINVK